MMTSWDSRDRPHQFRLIAENSLCSILFHLLVPGEVADGDPQEAAARSAWRCGTTTPLANNVFRQWMDACSAAERVFSETVLAPIPLRQVAGCSTRWSGRTTWDPLDWTLSTWRCRGT